MLEIPAWKAHGGHSLSSLQRGRRMGQQEAPDWATQPGLWAQLMWAKGRPPRENPGLPRLGLGFLEVCGIEGWAISTAGCTTADGGVQVLSLALGGGGGRREREEEGQRGGREKEGEEKSMLGSSHCNEMSAHVTRTIRSFPDRNMNSADGGAPLLAQGQGNLQVGLMRPSQSSGPQSLCSARRQA